LVLAFFGYRQVKAQARPGAQEAINAGFTALSDRQAVEIKELRTELRQTQRTAADAQLAAEHAEERAGAAEHQARQAKRQVSVLAGHVEDTTTWHLRHLPFDNWAQETISKVAPDELPASPPLEPFPQYRPIDDVESYDLRDVRRSTDSRDARGPNDPRDSRRQEDD
jgi:hypothetical protein